jgi:hypothetical protein
VIPTAVGLVTARQPCRSFLSLQEFDPLERRTPSSSPGEHDNADLAFRVARSNTDHLISTVQASTAARWRNRAQNDDSSPPLPRRSG